MNFLPAYLFLLFIVLLAYIRPKSIIIHFILLSVIFLFFAFSYDNADRLVYQYEFDTINSSSSSKYEVLYIALMKFGASFCDTFQQYRCFQSILVLVLIDKIVLKYSKAPNVVLASYLVFSALFDATLMRHIVAMSVSLYGLFLLISAKKIRDYIIVFLVIIICGLIHSSYWALLLFIPFWILLKRHPFLSLLFVLGGYIIVIRYQDIFLSIFSLLVIREGVVDKYMTGEYANLTGVLYDIIKYLFIISPCFIMGLFKSDNVLSSLKNKDKRVLLLNNNILTINLLFSVILIPQFFAIIYNRLFRVLILFNYIYMANMYVKNNSSRNYQIAFIIILYSFTLLLLLIFVEAKNTLIDVWNMHFETNSVFKLLSN